MLWLSLLPTITLALSATANSGIFDDSGNVKDTSITAESPRALRFDRSGVLGLTNAERIQRGQPLLQPKIRKVAARAEVSCASSIRNKGNIQVTRVSTGAVIGFLSRFYDSQNSYTIGTLAQAGVVQLPASQSSGFEITHLDSQSPNFPFVGAVGGSGGYNFSPGEVGYAYLAGTGHTAPNSPPSTTAGHSLQALGYNAPAESSIWSIACSGELSAQWTNAAGAAQSQPPTLFFFDATVSFLGLIGDFANFQSSYPFEDAYLVTLQFISLVV